MKFLRPIGDFWKGMSTKVKVVFTIMLAIILVLVTVLGVLAQSMILREVTMYMTIEVLPANIHVWLDEEMTVEITSGWHIGTRYRGETYDDVFYLSNDGDESVDVVFTMGGDGTTYIIPPVDFTLSPQPVTVPNDSTAVQINMTMAIHSDAAAGAYMWKLQIRQYDGTASSPPKPESLPLMVSRPPLVGAHLSGRS